MEYGTKAIRIEPDIFSLRKHLICNSKKVIIQINAEERDYNTNERVYRNYPSSEYTTHTL
jgi:hypothetical protein